jgi:hypothetical protein
VKAEAVSAEGKAARRAEEDASSEAVEVAEAGIAEDEAAEPDRAGPADEAAGHEEAGA